MSDAGKNFEDMLVDSIWEDVLGKDVDIGFTCLMFLGQRVDADRIRNLLWHRYKVFQDPISHVWYQCFTGIDTI